MYAEGRMIYEDSGSLNYDQSSALNIMGCELHRVLSQYYIKYTGMH